MQGRKNPKGRYSFKGTDELEVYNVVVSVKDAFSTGNRKFNFGVALVSGGLFSLEKEKPEVDGPRQAFAFL